MEPVAQRVSRRQFSPPDVPALGCLWRIRRYLGRARPGMPRTWWRQLGMASCRWRTGQSTFWGDQIGKNPTDRGKNGTKRSLLTEASGGPLAITIVGANTHDTKALKATLEAIIVERPCPTEDAPQHLCLDKAYDNPTGHATVAEFGYVGHIRRIGEEKLDSNHEKTYPARRWVVERTHGWLSKCRALLVRYDKKGTNYLGLLKLACALIWHRRHHQLTLLR